MGFVTEEWGWWKVDRRRPGGETNDLAVITSRVGTSCCMKYESSERRGGRKDAFWNSDDRFGAGFTEREQARAVAGLKWCQISMLVSVAREPHTCSTLCQAICPYPAIARFNTNASIYLKYSSKRKTPSKENDVTCFSFDVSVCELRATTTHDGNCRAKQNIPTITQPRKETKKGMISQVCIISISPC